jgi:hypothetical protein
VADPQPWRNPRPIPQLSEMEGRIQTPHQLRLLLAWLPALCWAVVIFSLSTDAFSADHTGRILRPILFWLMPHLTERGFDAIHFFVRKTAHFMEYFIFCLLLYRGIRTTRMALVVGASGAIYCRWLFSAGRDTPSFRGEPHRLSVRFPAGFDWSGVRRCSLILVVSVAIGSSRV